MQSYSYTKCSADGVMTPKGRLPSEMPVGIAYVPYQTWEEPYAENVALSKGTIFPCLDLPFLGKEGVKKYGK